MIKVNKCEFCNEFDNNETATKFTEIYSEILKSRCIYESDTFKVLPTLGQLFENSLLVVPKYHAETLADLTQQELHELSYLYQQIHNELAKYGHVIAFEHGARCQTGGGCGIYHAHLHVLPLPKSVDMFSFFKHKYQSYGDLVEAIEHAKNFNEYLFAVNSDSRAGILDLSKLPGAYQSQYFRRELSKYFQLASSWNWKEYTMPEQKLLSAVQNLRFPKLVSSF